MKHLEDLQNDLQRNGQKGAAPEFVDTRMMGISSPDSIHTPEFHTRERPESAPFTKPGLGSAKSFLLLALVFFLCAVGYFAYVFGRGAGSVSERNINIQMIGSSFVTSGAESQYEVVVENTNTSAINDAVVIVEVPQPGGDAPLSYRQSIGVIEARAQKKVSFPVTLFGAQFDDRELTGIVEFSFPGSRALLRRVTTLPVRIAQSPVRLEIEAPDRMTVGQDVVLEITASTQSLLTGVGIKVEYPEGFEVVSSSLAPAAGNYFWEFNRLSANKQIELKIKGQFRGLPILGASNSFRVSVGSVSRDERILSNIYATKSEEVVVSRSGVNAVLFVGNSSDDRVAVFPGADISGTVIVTNTTTEVLRNVSASMQIQGDYVDIGKSKFGAGYLDVAKKTVTWSGQAGAVELSALSPGQTVTLDYTLGTKQNWADGSLGGVSVSVQGQSSSGDLLNARDIDSIDFVQSARLGLTQKTLYNAGPFANTGANPPRVGETTTYTIEWALPRQVVDFSEVVVSAQLPVYVEWQDQVSPSGPKLTYDPNTRTVTWEHGDLPNSLSFDPSVSFQVAVTPSIVHKQTSPVIVDSVTLSGLNKLTGDRSSYNKPSHYTRLKGDTIESSGSVGE